MALSHLHGNLPQVFQQRVCARPDPGGGVGPKAALVIGIDRGPQFVPQMLRQGFKCRAVVVEAMHAQHDVSGLVVVPNAPGQTGSIGQIELNWQWCGCADGE